MEAEDRCKLYAKVFNNSGGLKVLEDLESKIIKDLSAYDLSDDDLRSIHGWNLAIQYIKNNIKKGEING